MSGAAAGKIEREGSGAAVLGDSRIALTPHRAATLIDNEQPANAAARREGYFGPPRTMAAIWSAKRTWLSSSGA